MKTLRIERGTKKYSVGSRHTRVLNDVSYEFKKGTSYAIVGSSGSGKSTLLHIIAGFDALTEGSLYWGDHNFEHMNDQEREHKLQRDLGFVFQHHYLVDELTVRDNLLLRALINQDDSLASQNEIDTLLVSVGLKNRVNHYPRQLSGGQQQRVAVARALVNKPSFLIADEPTGNLDSENGEALISLMSEFKQQTGMGMIIATHDPLVYKKMDVVIEVKDGKLL